MARRIKKIWKSRPTIEGAGVHLKRVFGNSEIPQLDPFLLLDDFHSDNPRHYLSGFPWHPHRGIETITYVLHGSVEHGDSMNNIGTIAPGDVQWMTAGSGIIHQEMPKGGKDYLLWGFQLWANLPASDKMMDPRYREVKSSQIPEMNLPSGAKVKVICGEVNGTNGPVKDIVTDPEYLDVSVPPDTTFSHEVSTGHTAFVYIVDGKACFDKKSDCKGSSETLILYEHEGDQIMITTEGSPARFLLISGRPIGEPIAWYGPIVMNTQEELRVAFEEYDKGTFIKHR